MMRSAIMLILVLLYTGTGCATSSLLSDRKNDAADMVTGTVGWGIGGKIQCGPVQAGLLKCEDQAGLRGGSFAVWRNTDRWEWHPPSSEWDIFFVGGSSFLPTNDHVRSRFKDFTTGKVGPITGAISFDKNPRAYLFSQIEIVAAVGPSIRIGVNPGEILDFVVGWLGFDLYDDDIYRYRDEARRLGEFRLSLEAESTATNKPNQHNE